MYRVLRGVLVHNFKVNPTLEEEEVEISADHEFVIAHDIGQSAVVISAREDSSCHHDGSEINKFHV